jgi:hypothetical protein
LLRPGKLCVQHAHDVARAVDGAFAALHLRKHDCFGIALVELLGGQDDVARLVAGMLSMTTAI